MKKEVIGKQQPILNTGVKAQLVESSSRLASPANCLSISLGRDRRKGEGGCDCSGINQISDLTCPIPQVPPPVGSYLIKTVRSYCVVAGFACAIYEFGANLPFVIESIS